MYINRNMGADLRCFKPQQTEEELNQIFSLSPEDDKVPDDRDLLANHSGKYPVNDDEEEVNFDYEAVYPDQIDPRPTVIRNIEDNDNYYYDDDRNDNFRSGQTSIFKRNKPNANQNAPSVSYPEDESVYSYPSDNYNYNVNYQNNKNYNYNDNYQYNKNDNYNDNYQNNNKYNYNDNNKNNNNYNYNDNYRNNNNYNPKNGDFNYIDNNPDLVPTDEMGDEEDEADELLARFDREGKVRDHGDFNRDGWRELYPEEANFFIWDGDGVNPLHNQTKIINKNNYYKAEVYRGDINPENGMRHGYGECFTKDHALIGTWRNDEFTGWGRETKRGEDESYTETKFINGEKQRKRIVKNPLKGITYKGTMEYNKKEGHGTFDTPKYYYEGDFRNGQFDGNGRIEYKGQRNIYEGSFKNGQIDGYGTFQFYNGDLYTGFMRKGKMDGKGKYQSVNGDVYEGEYYNGKKHGHGILTLHNGKTWEGNWYNGKKNK